MKEPKYLDRSPCYFELKYCDECMTCKFKMRCNFTRMIECFRYHSTLKLLKKFKEKYHA